MEMKNEVPVILDFEIKEKKRGLKLDKPRAEGGRDDVIVWSWPKAPKGLFMILFPDQSPFEQLEYKDKDGVIRAKIIYDSSQYGAKRFKYIIAASDNKEVFILDPEIIVPKPGKYGA